MTRVLLIPPDAIAGFDQLREDFVALHASASRTPGVVLEESPARADFILFVGCRDRFQQDLRRHTYFKRERRRCFAYDSADRVFPFLPGLYPSIERRHFRRRWTRSSCYLRWLDSTDVWHAPMDDGAPLLFSFVGAADTHPVRREILGLHHDRAFVEDSSGSVARHPGQSAVTYSEYKQHFGRVLRQSQFVLCPRGAGASSMRIFEAMKAGRVPVVISDAWSQPEGPEWSAFSVRVAESEVASLPGRLERLEPTAQSMGERARAAWERWYSPASVFRTFLSGLEDLGERNAWTDFEETSRTRMRMFAWLLTRAARRGLPRRIGT